MDVSDASYYIFNEKRKNKGSRMGHTKKILNKKDKGSFKNKIKWFDSQIKR